MRKLLIAIGGVLALTAGYAAQAAAPVGATAQTTRFDYEGVKQSFTVPAGVCSITVKVWGAEGGDGADVTAVRSPLGVAPGAVQGGEQGAAAADSGDGGTDGAQDTSGAKGGYETATIPVTPGETLTVNVGARGEDAEGQQGGDGGSSDAGNGGDGGDSLLAPTPTQALAGGGGGGGASSVTRGSERLVLAGGGGGGGGSGDDTAVGYVAGADVPGGDGGGEGEDGASAKDIIFFGFPEAGARGGQAGGDGGEGGKGADLVNGGKDGEDGSHNDGGDGASGRFQGGGGGGGGATGGGGGGSTGNISNVGGGGGGGGSGSELPGAQDGEREGNGLVDITWDPAAAPCIATADIKFTG